MDKEEMLLIIFAVTSCIDTVISLLRYCKGMGE